MPWKPLISGLAARRSISVASVLMATSTRLPVMPKSSMTASKAP